MNKKLIFRILGALSSALIIISVFVPFISRSGYSINLWETYSKVDSSYLPVMIIVFGAISLILFLINKKTEFCYMTTGAVLFFAIMMTADMINSDSFKYLSIGYYFSIIGPLLLGIMTFLNSNIAASNNEKGVKEVDVNDNRSSSILDKIDSLYNEPVNNQPQIQNIETAIKPLDSNEVAPLQEISDVNELKPIPDVAIEAPRVNPVLQEFGVVEEKKVEDEVVPSIPENPVIQEFSAPQENNLENKAQSLEAPNNPVLQDFNTPQESSVNDKVESFQSTSNPVLQEFESSIPTSFLNTEKVSSEPIQEIKNDAPASNPVPLANITVEPSPTVTESNLNSTQAQTTDIFGQPINK